MEGSKSKQLVSISSHQIGDPGKVYIVAEISANHSGDLDRALAIVDAAAEAGADAVKIQTLSPSKITLDSDRPEFQINKGPRKGMSLFELYQKAETPRSWHEPIFDRASKLGLDAFSSPFDLDAVDFLASKNVPAYKIASFEIVDLPLIEKAASNMRPMIISTGMASAEDIEDAVECCKRVGNEQIILLYCVSGYPTPVEETNLLKLQQLATRTGCLVGLSDHTLTISTSVAAVALGACFIEKHLTLSRDDGGLDAAFSLEPSEFSELTKSCREAALALGHASEGLKASEVFTSRLRRSLYVVRNIVKGEAFTPENTSSIRPNNGLPPKHYKTVLGRSATCDIEAGTPLSWELVGE
ncbi:pseudaminic acid synthase [Ruegeria conchae]|uniref:pseudaminic acid synthase n=1 Tax=Ruegeria conchae TaxID=981384 RepID=UPI0029C6B2BD|nr:pseudaminic acid synthase [Ruegeria conchae]